MQQSHTEHGGPTARPTGTPPVVRDLPDDALERLWEADFKYRNLVEQFPGVVYTADFGASGPWSFVSPQIESILGYSPDEWISDADLWCKRIHPDDRAEQLEKDAWTFTTGETLNTEYRMLARDGSLIWVSDHATVVRDDNGRPLFMQGVMFDITDRKIAEDALRGNERRFRALVQNSSDIVTVLDEDWQVGFATPAIEAILGHPVDSCKGRLFFDLIHPGDVGRVTKALEKAKTSVGASAEVAFRMIHADGSFKHVELIGNNLLDDPAIGGFVANIRDVTERSRFESLLSGRTQVLSLIVQNLPLEQTLGSLTRLLQRHSRGVCSILLYDPTHHALRHGARPELPDSYVDALDELGADLEQWRFGAALARGDRVISKDIATDPEWGDQSKLPLDHGLRACWSFPITAAGSDRVLGAIVSYYSEISVPDEEEIRLLEGTVHLASIAIERSSLQEQLTHQAFHDHLTNLANRALLADRVEHALARGGRTAEPIVLMFVDLDNFKTVNDSLGHSIGDQLLIGASERLKMCVRPADTVARLGGDEFALLFEGLSSEDILIVADRVLETLSAPLFLEGKEICISATVGIATGYAGVDSADDLLRNADVAMYEAKGLGKNRYAIFEPKMHEATLERLDLRADLQKAIERDEFLLHYQPIVELRTANIVGVEALVRWKHPTRGQLFPADFVPLAEDAGLISSIDYWVLREACKQAVAWKRSNEATPFYMSVNLSGRQLQQPELVGEVAACLVQTGLAAESLILEITESVLMHDVEVTAQRLGALKELGVGIAIDDFGVGYSSLSYLRQFPVDVLKMDKSFVDHVDGGFEDSAFAQAIVKLGRTLGLRTIAEGVERIQQVDHLVALGCDLGQGYHFARPLGFSEMGALIGASPDDSASSLAALVMEIGGMEG